MAENGEHPIEQLADEMIGLMREVAAKNVCHECNPLGLALRGVKGAFAHIDTGLRAVEENAATALTTNATEYRSLVGTVLNEATYLTETVQGIREGIDACPGKTEEGSCGLTQSQQYRTFYMKQPPVFRSGKKIWPIDED